MEVHALITDKHSPVNTHVCALCSKVVVEQVEQAHDEAVEEQEAGGDEGEGRERGRVHFHLLLQLLSSSSYRQERLHAAVHCTQLTAEDVRR